MYYILYNCSLKAASIYLSFLGRELLKMFEQLKRYFIIGVFCHNFCNSNAVIQIVVKPDSTTWIQIKMSIGSISSPTPLINSIEVNKSQLSGYLKYIFCSLSAVIILSLQLFSIQNLVLSKFY